MPQPAFDPAESWRKVVSAIDAAARAAGRDPADVGLTAVCKQQPWARVAAVLAAGQRVFGENRVQEAAERWQDWREGVELRLIGPLQTNKAREAIRLFDVIETLDRPRLARVLADEIAAAGVAPRLLVQVNTGEEPQKSGVAPAEADALHRRLPHRPWPAGRGIDVHPAAGRAGRTPLCPAAQDRGTQRPVMSSPWA